MERYRNLSGNSNVVAFEIGAGFITVQFGDGMKYLYTDRSTGAARIAEMQRLARAGQGLNSYIGRAVKKAFERKWR
ncbi:hypothetical protein E8F11_10495 [Pseudomonas sp. BN417]|uniref:hypothetical protein n=1 Tax=Pseudomonas sp. BN417 TaxID=2567890 RepID=UPI002453D719|nr:hypothetical protein [Pseudomonas sp. BN417]MDH4555601.1 hypothetical protein [Pseudomonas sp. BN417]